MMSSVSQAGEVEEAAVEQFCSITGANQEAARMILEACNWNIELAINMHVDANDVDVVHDNHVEPPVISVPNVTQHEESSSTDVRPPIPPVRQVLVEDYPSVSFGSHSRRPNPHSVFDAFRDFEAETKWQEEMVLNEGNSSANTSKRRTLEDLFRPPLDLICRGTLEIAKDEGQRQNKWLMVNIQNQQEFSCQVLNRDVWSHPAIKSIIKEHFIFWQTYHDVSEGQRFMQFYNVVDFPYVAILDPRTGERLRYWTAIDPVTFCDLITEFLLEHPSPSGSGNLESINLLRNNIKDKTSFGESEEMEMKDAIAPYDYSEEMQIKAAIAASLQDSRKGENEVDDSDFETFESDNEESVHVIDPLPSNETSLNESPLPSNAKDSSVSSPIVSKVDTHENFADEENWQKYLGPSTGASFEFAVRLPDGKRENITFPADTQLKALFLYLSSKGYSMSVYDLVTNFPKRNLSEISNSGGITLESAGIHPRDTLYVQLKT